MKRKLAFIGLIILKLIELPFMIVALIVGLIYALIRLCIIGCVSKDDFKEVGNALIEGFREGLKTWEIFLKTGKLVGVDEVESEET